MVCLGRAGPGHPVGIPRAPRPAAPAALGSVPRGRGWHTEGVVFLISPVIFPSDYDA